MPFYRTRSGRAEFLRLGLECTIFAASDGMFCAMSVSGDQEGLRVETDCCTSCGVPWHYAPEIFREGERSCEIIRQPRSATDVRKVLRVLQAQDLGCIRYLGSNPRVLALLEAAGCADSVGPHQPHSRTAPPRATPPRAPGGLSSVLSIAAVGSTLTLLAGVSSLMRWHGTAVINVPLGVAGLLLTWGARHRRPWAPRGFLALAGVAALAGILEYSVGRRTSLLGPMLFIAIALAVWSMRRWYTQSR